MGRSLIRPDTKQANQQQEEQNRLLEATISRLEAEVSLFSSLGKAWKNNDDDVGEEDQDTKQPSDVPAASSHDDDSAGSNVVTIEELMQHIELHSHNEIMLAAGLSFLSDAMDILGTYFLAMRFQGTSEWQGATVAASVFLGILCGTLLLPWWSITRGKRFVFCVTALLRPVIGACTLLADDFPTMTAIRFLVGFVAAGRVLAFDVLDEFSTKARPNLWVYIQFFWSIGIILVTTIESITRPDWKSMVIWTEVCILIASIFGILCLPESPSWLLRRGASNEALRAIGELSGPDFDWLVSIAPNPEVPPPTRSEYKAKWSIWGAWMSFGLLYYGGIYATTVLFGGSDEYFETAVASGEMGMVGVLLGWCGMTMIGARWTQIIGFFIGGLSVALLEALKEQEAAVIAFAIVGRTCLMAGITASVSYAFQNRLTTPLMFCLVHLGGAQAPFLIVGPWLVTVCVLAIETVTIVSCACYVSERTTALTTNSAALSAFV